MPGLIESVANLPFAGCPFLKIDQGQCTSSYIVQYTQSESIRPCHLTDSNLVTSPEKVENVVKSSRIHRFEAIGLP